MKKILFAACLAALVGMPLGANAQSWSADNGNGTYTNPLFYDEFSDPDIIRVGRTITSLAPRCIVCRDSWCSTPRTS